METREAPGVKPIKSVADLRKWEKYMEQHSPLKLHAYFVIGLDLGLNPTFLHRIRWDDIKSGELETAALHPETYLLVPSTIQDEPRKIIFSTKSVLMLKKLREKYPRDVYVFQSEVMNSRHKTKPITLQRLGLHLKESAINSGIPLPGAVGAVTLRKSFGYHHIVHGTWTLHELMRYFEQRTFRITRDYIGLTDEKIDETPLPRKPRSK